MSSFSKLFKLFVAVVFMPLVPMVLLLSYYQWHLRDNILETHVNLAEIVSYSLSQHIEDLTWRLAFSRGVAEQLSRKKDPTSVLQNALEANPDFLFLAVLSKDGKERYRAADSSISKRIEPLKLLPTELPPTEDERRLYISSFEVEQGRPISEFIYPLPDGDYLYGVISFFSFLARIQEQRIGNTGRIYIVAQDGSVYAGSHQYVPDFNQGELESALASKSHLITHLTTPQETYVGAFAPTPILGAYTAVLQLKREAFRSIYHTNIILILFLLTIAVFSYFGALTFAEQLGEPISSLSRAAREVSRGNLDVHVDEQQGWKEFKPLIISFNQMVQDLKDYQALQVQAELAQMKENVFRAIAHDLRAPLLGLQGYIYALQHGEPTQQEQSEYLAQMSTAAQNLSLLLEDALAVSRLQSGMTSVGKEKLDIHALLKQVYDSLSPVAAEKKLDFTVHTDVDTLVGDGKILLRVLMNLVSNAIKFTEKGFVRVDVVQYKKEYILSVQDSGIGMNTQEIKTLFQKFHQIDSAKSGYGLGLFISRQLVEALGGKLEVSSVKGKGSVFTVHLKQEEI